MRPFRPKIISRSRFFVLLKLAYIDYVGFCLIFNGPCAPFWLATHSAVIPWVRGIFEPYAAPPLSSTGLVWLLSGSLATSVRPDGDDDDESEDPGASGLRTSAPDVHEGKLLSKE